MRRILLYATAFCLYALAAAALTAPLITQPGTRLIGHPFGDTTEYLHHIWAMHEALSQGRDPFFQPLLMYPDGLDGTLLWSLPLQSFPQWLLMSFLPLPVAHNLTALATLALNGLSMFALMRALLCEQPGPARTWAALLAGYAFMSAPTFMGQLGLGHIGLLVLYPGVLAVRVLLALRHPPAGRRAWLLRAAAAGLLLAMSAWGSLLLPLYLTLPALAAPLLTWAARREWAALRRGLLALALGALFSLPFVVPALRAAASAPASFRDDAVVQFSADLLSAVAPSFNNPIYSAFAYNRAVLGVDPFELAGYLGLFTTLLALLGVRRFAAARPWLVVLLAAWVLSLGPLLKVLGQPVTVSIDGNPTFISLPYAWVAGLPGLNLTRTPARFQFAVAFALVVMAGYGTAALLAWAGRWPRALRAGGMALLFAALALDTLWGVPTTDGAALLRAAPTIASRGGAVFDVPWAHLLVDKEAMFVQTAHGLPIIGGHIARATPLNPAKGWLLESLDPALLDQAEVRTIVLHREWDDAAGALEAALLARFGPPLYHDDALAVFAVPDYAGPPPAFTVLSRAGARLETTADVLVYAPAPGGALLTAALASPTARDVIVSLDGAALARYTIDGAAEAQVWIEFPAGYHTVTLALDPPCPIPAAAVLACAAVDIRSLRLEQP